MTNSTINYRHLNTQTTLKALAILMLGSTLLIPTVIAPSYAATGDFVLKFGSFGTGEGQFIVPSDVTVTSNDRLIVVDKNNHRVQIFQLVAGSVCPSDTDKIVDGICFVKEFGSFGIGNGQFSSPVGITTDASDRIIVSDTNNHRIQIFEMVTENTCPSGTDKIVDGICFVKEFGSFGSGDGEFNLPQGITVDSSGNIAVTDQANHRIQIFDSNGNFITKFGSAGTGDGQFNFPPDITVDSSDNIILADKGNSRIQIFDPDGNFITKFGSFGSGDGQFNSPEGITVDSGDRIIVSDTGNHRIQIFDGTTSVDTEPPVITLNGNNPAELIEGQTYTEQGATVTDNSGEDLSSDLIIDASAVDTNTAGTYQVTYDVSDSSGNDATTVIRTVTVISASDAVGDLIGTIENAGYPNGVENSLLAPLKQIEKLLNDGNPNNDGAVCDKLTSFVDKVDDKESSGQLSSVDAAELRAAANNVLDALGC